MLESERGLVMSGFGLAKAMALRAEKRKIYNCGLKGMMSGSLTDFPMGIMKRSIGAANVP